MTWHVSKGKLNWLEMNQSSLVKLNGSLWGYWKMDNVNQMEVQRGRKKNIFESFANYFILMVVVIYFFQETYSCIEYAKK